MMKELLVKGTQEFLGMNIPVIEGGFGENQKVILAKTVAKIHEISAREVNQLIKNNIDEFEFGIDILDLKQVISNDLFLEHGLFTKAQWGNSKNIYLLSEQGYMALVQLMRTEKAKEIRKKLRREYFAMREVINSNEQLKAQLLLSIYNGGVDAVNATRELVKIEVDEATTPLVETIEEQKPMVDFANHVSSSTDTIDVGTLSKIAQNENIQVGRNTLFKFLRENGYLMNNNVPYQKHIDNGLFEVVEVVKNTAYGSNVFPKTLVTGKGQINIIERLRKEFPCKN